MTEPHKRLHRHPKYKTAYRVKNWCQYDKSLRDRCDITLWLSQDAIDAWTPPMTGKRGAQPVYSDLAMHAQKHGEKKPKRWKKLHIGAYRKIKRAFPPPAAPTLSSTPRHLQCPQRASAAAAA